MPSLLFRNASVITMDPRRPRAQAVLIRDDRIAWVGQTNEAPSYPIDRVVDCGGTTLVPGLIDAHMHLLAYASSLHLLDCSRKAVASVADISALIRAQAQATPTGEWIRGRGYDEFFLEERRHPNRAELDAAAPHHPVRLDHRSGHACVVNSLGLGLLGIAPDTPDPPEGIIQRDDDGNPTGLLLEMGGYVSQRMREFNDQQRLASLLAEANQELLRWGVTSVQDASRENDVERWHTLRRMQEDGVVRQRLTLMPGIRHLAQFTDAGLAYGAGDDWIRMGPTKLVVTLTTGVLYPPEEEILALVRDAHHKGFPVAAHAVEEEAIVAVLRAFLASRGSQSGQRLTDRVEHCSEATPKVQSLLKGSGVAVVTQPGFLYESAERYAATVSQAMQPWLYPLRTLRNLGLVLAAGSDAPVASPNPWWGLYSAMTRRNADGLVLHLEQSLPLENALGMYTLGAAAVSQEDLWKGSIQPGKLADLVLLDRDIASILPEELRKAQVVLSTIGGEVVLEG